MPKVKKPKEEISSTPFLNPSQSEEASNAPGPVTSEELKSEVKEIKEARDQKETVWKKRKRREAENLQAQAQQFEQGLNLISNILLDLGVQWLPNPLPCTETEKMVFSQALNAVTIKRFESFAQYAAEIALLIAVVAIVVPRMKKPIEEEAQNELAGAREASSTDNRENGERKNEVEQVTPEEVEQISHVGSLI